MMTLLTSGRLHPYQFTHDSRSAKTINGIENVNVSIDIRKVRLRNTILYLPS